MKKKYVDIRKCNNGDVIAEDIVNPYGGLLVNENTIINETIKKKLIEIDIRRIRIFDLSDLNGSESEEDILLETGEKYYENIDYVKEIFTGIVTGKKIDEAKLNAISDSLYDQITNERYILQFINELKSTDEYTYCHSVNVSVYSMIIGKWLKLSKSRIKELIQVGLLHDMGKVKIPNEILNKTGKLDSAEFSFIKRHPSFGYEIISSIDNINENIKLGVLMHHEREDGSGYPLGITGRCINLYSKIVAIADVYDAITSDRVYKRKVSPFHAFDEFINGMFGCFDTSILYLFLKNIASYYVGSKVLLSNKDIGEVMYINPQDISNPIVRIDSELIDLSSQKDINILNLLSS